MQLDQYQRTVLANQHRILAMLAKGEDQTWHEQRAEVFENGYEGEYHLVDKDVLSLEESTYVGDVLSMFRVLKSSYRELADKEGIDERDIRFLGFDLNDPMEGRLVGYVRYLWRDDRFTESATDGDQGNSHTAMRHHYRAMLAVWRATEQRPLTREHILRIVMAGRQAA